MLSYIELHGLYPGFQDVPACVRVAPQSTLGSRGSNRRRALIEVLFFVSLYFKTSRSYH